MLRGRVLAGLLVCCALLWSQRAHAQCTKDLDCKADRVCDAGKCQAPAVVAAPVVAAPVPVVAPATEPVQYRRRSTAMMVTGIAATSLGAASLFTALGLAIVSVDCRNDLENAEADAGLTSSA